MILHRDEPLSFEDLGRSRPTPVSVPQAATTDTPLELDAVTAAHITRVLEMAGGKIHGPGGAGELLGVNPNTLRYKMRKLGIPFGRHQQRP
jgi:transcriptional regulator with GAF, ATPase, and Fis domain